MVPLKVKTEILTFVELKSGMVVAREEEGNESQRCAAECYTQHHDVILHTYKLCMQVYYFISVAVMRHPDKKQFRGEFTLSRRSRLQSIRCRSQKLEPEGGCHMPSQEQRKFYCYMPSHFSTLPHYRTA